jgi:hypothetical protein
MCATVLLEAMRIAVIFIVFLARLAFNAKRSPEIARFEQKPQKPPKNVDRWSQNPARHELSRDEIYVRKPPHYQRHQSSALTMADWIVPGDSGRLWGDS